MYRKITQIKFPLKNVHEQLVYNNISRLNKWYINFIGLDEVKCLQDKVINLQNKLLDAQDKRREVGTYLDELKQQSLKLQEQMYAFKRSSDTEKFLEVLNDQIKVERLEKDVYCKFRDQERIERELFTAYTNAIRDSYEKQRAQMEYTKYFGIILGIAGSFLGFAYSSVKRHDLKKLLSNNETKNELSKVNAQIGELLKNSKSSYTSYITSGVKWGWNFGSSNVVRLYKFVVRSKD